MLENDNLYEWNVSILIDDFAFYKLLNKYFWQTIRIDTITLRNIIVNQ